jgi:hypothetical protein
LVSLFVSALSWNVATWWFALPNSSSHCLIGALIGVAVGNALVRSRSVSDGVHWPQLWKVLEPSPYRRFWASCSPARYFFCAANCCMTLTFMNPQATNRPYGGCAASSF